MTRPPLLYGHDPAKHKPVGRFTHITQTPRSVSFRVQLAPHEWFAFTARHVYGPGWQSKAARDLGVDRSTVWRWANARTPVPGHAMLWLKELMLRAEKGITQPGAS